MDDLKIKITDVLIDLGVSADLSGFHYIREAIVMLINNGHLMSFSKEIYPQIAQVYFTSISCVGRSIRSCVEKAFLCGNKESLDKMFGSIINTKTGMVTNAQFISTIADKIKIGAI